jgi:4-amino-4-deoxychorismate lyase
LSLLLETIKIEDGNIENIAYHQLRFDKSRKELFNISHNTDLYSLIKAPQKGLFRCRILYDKEIRSIEYIPYIAKEIKKLKIITSNIDYRYKYTDRVELNSLLEIESEYDEIIIEKNGYLTDTTISNIAFYDGSKWQTPTYPLLEGTVRAKLLDEGFLHKKKIKKEELKNYSKIALMNSMIGFKILEVSLDDLIIKT